MKQMIFIFIALFVINTAKGQTLQFTYDAAGNQIKRELVVISVNSVLSTNNIEDTVNEEETPLPKSNSLNENSTIIEFYPNPVVDLLNVEWSSELHLTQIMIFDNMGKLLQIKKVKSSTQRETFNFSTYSAGIYYIRVFDAAEQSKSYKIIKH